jgi:hypothetical protein
VGLPVAEPAIIREAALKLTVALLSSLYGKEKREADAMISCVDENDPSLLSVKLGC